MSRGLFLFLSFTWGIVMSAIGIVAFVILRLLGYKPKRNQYSWLFEVGEGWGGVTLGPVIIVNENPNQYLLDHEFGHSLQNCYFGPDMISVSILSFIRYWYREIRKAKGLTNTKYDDIWFEGSATYLGQHYHKYTDK